MNLVLYNSYTRKKELFSPLDNKRVTVYACGPTVYGPGHIGNGRSAIIFDTLVRLLRFKYKNIIYARNITDVDDKIIKRPCLLWLRVSIIVMPHSELALASDR